jgi:O-antigen biosynthesis protein
MSLDPVDGELPESTSMDEVTRARRDELWASLSDEAYRTAHSESRLHAPLISVLIRLEADATEAEIVATLSTCAQQTYGNFEVVLHCADSEAGMAEEACRRLGKGGMYRVLVAGREAWLASLAACRGDLVGAVSAGDLLKPWALSQLAQARTDSDAGTVLLYSDESQLSATGQPVLLFKPAWSPVFMSQHNYIGDTWFVDRSSLVVALERAEPAMVDPHDVLIKIGQTVSAVVHIPAVLYSASKPRVIAPRSSDASATRLARDGDNPLVSAIIPTRGADLPLLEKCLRGLLDSTGYANLEVLVVTNNLGPATAEVERIVSQCGARPLNWNRPFNWSAVNNFAAAEARGELLLFMNDDLEVVDPGWLHGLVDLSLKFKAGVVAPLLLYPNGHVQHGGMNLVFHGGGVRHLFRGFTRTERNAQWLLRYPREVTALTGATMLIPRPVFEAANGFDEQFSLVCNDVDFCLRLERLGLSVLINPESVLVHHEGISRQGVDELPDVLRFWKKWLHRLREGDMYWNPNLDFDRDNWVPDSALVCTHKARTVGGRVYSMGVIQ